VPPKKKSVIWEKEQNCISESVCLKRLQKTGMGKKMLEDEKCWNNPSMYEYNRYSYDEWM
jgi:hypothetical protein